MEGDASSKPTAQRGPACTKLWPTWKSSLQPNRKRCWSTALQKLLLQSFTVEARRVGRARPACAGRAAIRTPGKVRRAEDCPPYQCNCHGARASTPAEIRSGQRDYLQACRAPVLLHPKKDLKAVLLTGWRCGQDGRAPKLPKGARPSRSQKTCGQDGSATICPKARRVGRARSPLRAGVARADPGF